MFSIIIPIYNEEKNLDNLIYEIYHSLGNIYKDFELILVNDCSLDNTIIKVEELKKNYQIKLINNKHNRGQSYSISEGIKISKYKTIVTLDGDGQNNPIDIPVLLRKFILNDEIFLIGGIRKNRKDNLLKIISSKIANKVREYVLKDSCNDTGCSLKVFDKDVFLQFPFFNGIHRFLPALFKGYGYKTFFIEVDHRPRLEGNSNYGTLDRLFKGISDIIRVKKIINKMKK